MAAVPLDQRGSSCRGCIYRWLLQKISPLLVEEEQDRGAGEATVGAHAKYLQELKSDAYQDLAADMLSKQATPTCRWQAPLFRTVVSFFLPLAMAPS